MLKFSISHQSNPSGPPALRVDNKSVILVANQTSADVGVAPVSNNV